MKTCKKATLATTKRWQERKTPSELAEILCVGSPGGHMWPKVISLSLLVWLLRIGLLNTLLFAVPVTIHSIILWALLSVLKNELHHCEAQLKNKLSFGIFNGLI